jgi:head-tail adaptor
MQDARTFRHVVQVQGPGDPVPDGDGGYTEAFGPLTPPDWHCAISPASPKDLENIGSGTVIAQATHIVTGRYHKGINTETRLLFRGRVLNVVAVVNVDERDRELQLACAEVVT